MPRLPFAAFAASAAITLTCALSFAMLLGTRPAHAASVQGQVFEDRIKLADQDLQLNGLGLRSAAWLNGFAAGLYLVDKQQTVNGVLKAPGAKRVQLQMMIDVPAAEFSKALKKGIRRNSSEAEWAKLTDRVAQFDRAVNGLGNTRKGDVFNLDYLPGQGMVFSANGTQRGPVIAGDDFYDAVLKIFLGERPVDKKLKAGLLGANPG